MALELLGRHEDARAELAEALRTSGDPQIRVNLASSLESLGRYQEAVTVLEAVPVDHPARAVARRNMGILYSTRLGRPDDALQVLRESITLDPYQQGADAVRAEIRRLESRGPTRPTSP
jgi:tetratricopeptide (TPR) repeat protein